MQKAFKNRAGPTWVRRCTQGHVAEPHGPAQRLHGALYILYSYITYSIMGFQPSVDRKGIQPIRLLGVINRTISFLLFRVGLIHTAFTMQVTWRDGSNGRSIDAHWSHAPWTTDGSIKHVLFKTNYNGEIICNVAASYAPIEWRHGAPEINQARAYLNQVITAVFYCAKTHRDPTDAIWCVL